MRTASLVLMVALAAAWPARAEQPRARYLWSVTAAPDGPPEQRAEAEKQVRTLVADSPDVHLLEAEGKQAQPILDRLADPPPCLVDASTCPSAVLHLLEVSGLTAFVEVRTATAPDGVRAQITVADAAHPTPVAVDLVRPTVSQAVTDALLQALPGVAAAGDTFWREVDARPYYVRVGFRAARRADWKPRVASKVFSDNPATAPTVDMARGVVLGFNGVEAEFGSVKGMVGLTWLRLGFVTTGGTISASLDPTGAWSNAVFDKFAVDRVWQIYIEPAQFQFRVPFWYLAPYLEGGLGFLREQADFRLRSADDTAWLDEESFDRWLIYVTFRVGMRAHPVRWLVLDLAFDLRQGIYQDYFTDLGMNGSVGFHF